MNDGEAGKPPRADAVTPRAAARAHDLARIADALMQAAAILRAVDPRAVEVAYKGAGSPVTVADRAVDDAFRSSLPRGDEGWLSEESVDDRSRLGHRRAVAGGIYAPRREQLFLGSVETGSTRTGDRSPRGRAQRARRPASTALAREGHCCIQYSIEGGAWRLVMAVRLNITMDEAVYARLKKEVRPKRISAFITEAVRAKLSADPRSLEAGYRAARKERWRRSLSDDWRHTETEAWPE